MVLTLSGNHSDFNADTANPISVETQIIERVFAEANVDVGLIVTDSISSGGDGIEVRYTVTCDDEETCSNALAIDAATWNTAINDVTTTQDKYQFDSNDVVDSETPPPV